LFFRQGKMSGFPYNTWYDAGTFSNYTNVYSSHIKDFYNIKIADPFQNTLPTQHSVSCGSPSNDGKRKKSRLLPNCDDVTIFPRRKSGQDKLGSNRPPIVITRQKLEGFFNMPQHQVCKKLGVCATVIKKVCRQLGIAKWPFKGNKIVLRKQGLFSPVKSETSPHNLTGEASSSQASSKENFARSKVPGKGKKIEDAVLARSRMVTKVLPPLPPLPSNQVTEVSRPCPTLPSLIEEPLFSSTSASSLNTEYSDGTEMTSSETSEGFDLSWLVPNDSDLEILDGLQLPAAH